MLAWLVWILSVLLVLVAPSVSCPCRLRSLQAGWTARCSPVDLGVPTDTSRNLRIRATIPSPDVAPGLMGLDCAGLCFDEASERLAATSSSSVVSTEPQASSFLWRFSTAWYGTVRYGTVHFWGVFHWVLYLVPDTFLVPLRSRFHRAVPLPKRDV